MSDNGKTANQKSGGKNLLYILPLLTLVLLTVLTGALFYIAKPQNPGLAEIPAFNVDGLSDTDLRSGDGLRAVNFFASWCVPCEAEHPFVAQLAQSLPVYGIAFMDEPEKIAAYLDRHGQIYKAIGYDLNGTAGISWGVTGVPATFLIDGKGRILLREDGPLTPDILKEKFMPVIAEHP